MTLSKIPHYQKNNVEQLPSHKIPLSSFNSEFWSHLITFLDFKSIFTSLKLTNKELSTTIPFDELWTAERMKQCYLKGVAPRYLTTNRSIPFLDLSLREALYTSSKDMRILYTRMSQLKEDDPFFVSPTTEALVLHFDAAQLLDKISNLEKNMLHNGALIRKLQSLSTPLGHRKINRDYQLHCFRARELNRQLQQIPDTSASMAKRVIVQEQLNSINTYLDTQESIFEWLSRTPEEIATALQNALQQREKLQEEMIAKHKQLASYRAILTKSMDGKVCLISADNPDSMDRGLGIPILLSKWNIPETFHMGTALTNAFISDGQLEDGGDGEEELSPATLQLLQKCTRPMDPNSLLTNAVRDLSTPKTHPSLWTCIGLIARLGELHEEIVFLSLKLEQTNTEAEIAQINQSIEDSKLRINQEKEKLLQQLAAHGLDLVYMAIQVNLENGSFVNRGWSVREISLYSSDELKGLARETLSWVQRMTQQIQEPRFEDMTTLHAQAFTAQVVNAIEVMGTQIWHIAKILEQRGMDCSIDYFESGFLRYPTAIRFGVDEDRKEAEEDIEAPNFVEGIQAVQSEDDEDDEDGELQGVLANSLQDVD